MNEDQAAFLQLQWAVQALAASPHDQVRLHPEFACVSCELRSDFENWHEATSWRSSLGITKEQSLALQAVMTQIDALEPTPCFTAEPLERSDWSRLRELAIECLRQFGWKRELPPVERNVDVRGA